MKRILVITYWSLREPLIENYTLPYLRLIRLFLAEGGYVLLVTMEKEGHACDEEEKERRRSRLWEEGIEWIPENYRSFGIQAAWKWSALTRRFSKKGRDKEFDAVHAWGTPAGAPAYRIARKARKPLIIDSFEPHAESMLEVGEWRRKGFAFPTLFRFEKLQARAANVVIGTSPTMKAYSWNRYRAVHPCFMVKPACVDRSELIEKADLYKEVPPATEDRVVGIYAGKFGGIYLEEEVFDMIRAAYEEWGDRFFMILLTDMSLDKSERWLEQKEIPRSAIHQEWVEPEKIPAYLDKADFAINPVRPVPSKRHCTSIKDGEYWAMGLPVMIPEGISEDSDIIRKEGIGVVLESLSWDRIREGMKAMRHLLEDPDLPSLKERIRNIAERERGYDRALEVYRRLYGEASYKHTPTTILLIAYYKHEDPVFQSALLDYFKNFPGKEGYRFLLLTFEENPLPEEEVEKLQNEWIGEEIYWERVFSRNFPLKVGQKLRDLLAGIQKGKRLMRRHGVDIVYSEGFPSAIMGHRIARDHDTPHVVHTYEPHAEYMREAGIWGKNSLEYRATRHYEQKLLKDADVLITGTQRMIEEAGEEGARAQFLRIPSCVNLEFFSFDKEAREGVRKEEGIPEEALVLVYLGKMGGMYYDRELLELFAEFRKGRPELDPHFLILSSIQEEFLLGLAEEVGVDAHKIRLRYLPRVKVPSYLSAADLALSGVRQTPSKAYCSPIKHGEYWGVGLPLLIFRGVSEDDRWVEEEGCGVVLERPEREEYQKAVEKGVELLKGGREQIRRKCRELAEKERSLSKAQHLLKRSFQELVPSKGASDAAYRK